MTGCDHRLRRFGHVAALAVFAGFTCGGLSAQPSVDSVPTQAVYGSGVHSFFAGQLARSYDDLTNAIEAGSRDPRVYYFRGLAALRMGRTDEAEADFSTGAELELDSKRLMVVDVPRSLERIQGPDRLQLERHRTRARVVVQQRNRRAAENRYRDTQDAQEDVLREPRAGGGDIRQDVEEQFGGRELPSGKPPAELPPATDAEEERDAKPAMDDTLERVRPEPATEENAAPAEPAADAVPEPTVEPGGAPADAPRDEAAADGDAAGAGTAEPPADAGGGDAADLPAERDAPEPAMEENSGLDNTEPFTP